MITRIEPRIFDHLFHYRIFPISLTRLRKHKVKLNFKLGFSSSVSAQNVLMADWLGLGDAYWWGIEYCKVHRVQIKGGVRLGTRTQMDQALGVGFKAFWIAIRPDNWDKVTEQQNHSIRSVVSNVEWMIEQQAFMEWREVAQGGASNFVGRRRIIVCLCLLHFCCYGSQVLCARATIINSGRWQKKTLPCNSMLHKVAWDVVCFVYRYFRYFFIFKT